MSDYNQLVQQAERMRNTLHDLLDQPNDPQARTVQSNVERLISDLRQEKGRDAIDNDLKNIINSLKHVEAGVMDFGDSNRIAGLCEDLRKQAAKL